DAGSAGASEGAMQMTVFPAALTAGQTPSAKPPSTRRCPSLKHCPSTGHWGPSLSRKPVWQCSTVGHVGDTLQHVVARALEGVNVAPSRRLFTAVVTIGGSSIACSS